MLQTMRSAAVYIWWIVVLVFVGGFVFYQTSGLTSRNVTRGTAVARVNGEPITVDQYDRTVRALTEQAQNQGQSLSLDEQRRLEEQAYNQLVRDVLIHQELARRGIRVTDDEIAQAAQTQPPPDVYNDPELQTDGRFDPAKYQRFLRSPAARQQGLLASLESYYRNVIPQAKLAQQLTTGIYVTDAQLWSLWRDQHDSAQVSFVAFTPGMIPDSAVTVTDKEIRTYYDEHRQQLGDRPGRAVVSILMLPRPVTAADTAAARQHALQLRNEIVSGARFEDVAKRESADTASGAQGGLIGPVTRGSGYVKPFVDAALALAPGALSQPILSPFGFHLIKVDRRNGDTAIVRHILVRIAESDSTAAIVDRKADELARLAAESDDPKKFDAAARAMQLPVGHIVVTEGDPATWNGQYVPDVAAWAFGGAKPQETSTLIDSDRAYYLARLDSVQEGGKPTLEAVRTDIRRVISQRKKIALLEPRAQKVATAVASGSTLEQAAQAAGLAVQHSTMFARTSTVPGIGRLNEVIGAAFALPVGAVSEPITAQTGVFVIRVDRRVQADRAAWLAQKAQQRDLVLDQVRQQRLQQFMLDLRQSAKIEDDRKLLRQTRQSAAA